MDWKVREQLSREIADYRRAVDNAHEANKKLQVALKNRQEEYDKMAADPNKGWMLRPLIALREYGLQESDLKRLQNYNFIYEIWLVRHNPNWSQSYGAGVGRTTRERLSKAMDRMEEVYFNGKP